MFYKVFGREKLDRHSLVGDIVTPDLAAIDLPSLFDDGIGRVAW